MQVAKISAVAYPAFVTLRSDLTTFGALLFSPADAQLGIALAPMARATVKALAVMVVVAGLDLALTRYRFMARMKMTKEETKREHKEDEGDPLIRSKRRRRHRELAKGRAQVEVPRADALVVNPTHIAIAIRYRKSDGRAPRVTAKGKGELAELMRDLARSNGIPIVQDIPLARLLFKRVKVGGEVPAETYRAVAAILAFVYRVTGRNPNANTNAGAGASA
jgi:flagellar biosynthesis protein FlhB